MDINIQNLVINNHHINLLRAMKDYHTRHYIWEMAKIMVPAFITGVITFVAMRVIDNKNKKRWLNDGHMKRKVELEIQIRKLLLGIKANVSDEYYVLGDLYSSKNRAGFEDIDSVTIHNFNKDFESLAKYLESEKAEKEHLFDDKSLFALMDEYVCYVPNIQSLFEDFKEFSHEISDLKTICKNDDSKSKANIMHGDVIELVRKKPEHFESMVNAYLCFQLAVDRILKKIAVKKLK